MDGAAAAAEGAVVAVALAAAVVFMVVAEAVVIAVAAVVPDELLRCRVLAVVAAGVLVVVMAVEVDRVEVWLARARVAAAPVLGLAVARCSGRKAIGKGSAACRRRIGQAAESVNDRVAAVRVLDLEQVARDRVRTSPVEVVAVDQALAAVGVPVAVVRLKVNSTTSWILVVAAVDDHPLVGLRSLVVLVAKRRATRLTISCAIGRRADSVPRLALVERDRAPVISLVVVDRDDQAVAIWDRVAPARVEVESNDRVDQEVVVAIARAVPVAVVGESNVRDDLAVEMMAADRAFLVVAAIDLADRVMGIVLVAPVTVIVPDVREAAIVRADQGMEIDPVDLEMEIAQGVRAMETVREDLVITTIGRAVRVIARDVQVIVPIGPIVRIGRIAVPIGTNGRIGVTIVGRM